MEYAGDVVGVGDDFEDAHAAAAQAADRDVDGKDAGQEPDDVEPDLVLEPPPPESVPGFSPWPSVPAATRTAAVARWCLTRIE